LGARGDSELLHQPEPVRIAMLLDKLAVTDPGDRDACDEHSRSRGRDTDKVAGACREWVIE
jgi:hypothetical protein